MQVDFADTKIRQTSDDRRREAGYHMSPQKNDDNLDWSMILRIKRFACLAPFLTDHMIILN